MTSLSSQLKALSGEPGPLRSVEVASLLLPPRVAAGVPLSSIRDLARRRFGELCEETPELHRFEPLLFGSEVAASGRQRLNASEEAAVAAELADLLVLLSQGLRKEPVQQVMEYLLRGFDVASRDPQVLSAVFLHEHSSPAFVRLAQNLPRQSPLLSLTSQFVDRGRGVPRVFLATTALKQQRPLLSSLLDANLRHLELADPQTQPPSLRFLAALAVEHLAAVPDAAPLVAAVAARLWAVGPRGAIPARQAAVFLTAALVAAERVDAGRIRALLAEGLRQTPECPRLQGLLLLCLSRPGFKVTAGLLAVLPPNPVPAQFSPLPLARAVAALVARKAAKSADPKPALIALADLIDKVEPPRLPGLFAPLCALMTALPPTVLAPLLSRLKPRLPREFYLRARAAGVLATHRAALGDPLARAILPSPAPESLALLPAHLNTDSTAAESFFSAIRRDAQRLSAEGCEELITLLETAASGSARFRPELAAAAVEGLARLAPGRDSLPQLRRAALAALLRSDAPTDSPGFRTAVARLKLAEDRDESLRALSEFLTRGAGSAVPPSAALVGDAGLVLALATRLPPLEGRSLLVSALSALASAELPAAASGFSRVAAVLRASEGDASRGAIEAPLRTLIARCEAAGLAEAVAGLARLLAEIGASAKDSGRWIESLASGRGSPELLAACEASELKVEASDFEGLKKALGLLTLRVLGGDSALLELSKRLGLAVKDFCVSQLEKKSRLVTILGELLAVRVAETGAARRTTAVLAKFWREDSNRPALLALIDSGRAAKPEGSLLAGLIFVARAAPDELARPVLESLSGFGDEPRLELLALFLRTGDMERSVAVASTLDGSVDAAFRRLKPQLLIAQDFVKVIVATELYKRGLRAPLAELKPSPSELLLFALLAARVHGARGLLPGVIARTQRLKDLPVAFALVGLARDEVLAGAAGAWPQLLVTALDAAEKRRGQWAALSDPQQAGSEDPTSHLGLIARTVLNSAAPRAAAPFLDFLAAPPSTAANSGHLLIRTDKLVSAPVLRALARPARPEDPAFEALARLALLCPATRDPVVSCLEATLRGPGGDPRGALARAARLLPRLRGAAARLRVARAALDCLESAKLPLEAANELFASLGDSRPALLAAAVLLRESGRLAQLNAEFRRTAALLDAPGEKLRVTIWLKRLAASLLAGGESAGQAAPPRDAVAAAVASTVGPNGRAKLGAAAGLLSASLLRDRSFVRLQRAEIPKAVAELVALQAALDLRARELRPRESKLSKVVSSVSGGSLEALLSRVAPSAPLVALALLTESLGLRVGDPAAFWATALAAPLRVAGRAALPATAASALPRLLDLALAAKGPCAPEFAENFLLLLHLLCQTNLEAVAKAVPIDSLLPLISSRPTLDARLNGCLLLAKLLTLRDESSLSSLNPVALELFDAALGFRPPLPFSRANFLSQLAATPNPLAGATETTAAAGGALELLLGAAGGLAEPFVAPATVLASRLGHGRSAALRVLAVAVDVRAALPALDALMEAGDPHVFAAASELTGSLAGSLTPELFREQGAQLSDLVLAGLRGVESFAARGADPLPLLAHWTAAFNAVALKCQARQLAALFARVVQWTRQGARGSLRLTIALSVLNGLLETLGSLAVPLTGEVLEPLLETLSHSPSDHEPLAASKLSKRSSRPRDLSLLRLCLSTLMRVFEHDRALFVDALKFDRLIEAFAGLLEDPSTAQPLSEQHLFPAVRGLLENSPTPGLIAAAFRLVLRKAGVADPKTRLLAAQLALFLVQGLRDAALSAQTEILAHVQGLLEDESLEVALVAKHLVKELEAISGDNLEEMLEEMHQNADD